MIENVQAFGHDALRFKILIKTGSYVAYSGTGENKKLVRIWWVEELRLA